MGKEKILVVEDEEAIQELIRYNLNKDGYDRVRCCESGEEALAAATEFAPDLILLDLMLPGMDGLAVCRRLKSDTRTSAIPIIMLTAKSEESDIVIGLEMGADDYLPKPFNSYNSRSDGRKSVSSPNTSAAIDLNFFCTIEKFPPFIFDLLFTTAR